MRVNPQMRRIAWFRHGRDGEDDVLNLVPASCPYCGEPIELLSDPAAGPQAYVEDCSVCCRPMLVEWSEDAAGDLHLRVRRDDDA